MLKVFPIEPVSNLRILHGNNGKVKIYYGAYAWGKKEWVGTLYPKKTRERDFLAHYVEHFNSIELHATHNEMYPPEKIKGWTDKAFGKDFLFCPKVVQSISHYSSFANVEHLTDAFLKEIYEFGEHLGAVLLQVSDRFSPNRKASLFEYLSLLPSTLQLFLEVRNPDWFEENEYHGLLNFLRSKKVGLVISDNKVRELHLGLTVPKCYIRYTPTGDFSRLDMWYKKIIDWGNRGLTHAYFFFQMVEAENQSLLLDELLYFKSLVEEG